MKKYVKLLAVLLLIGGLFTITGCGKKEEKKKEPVNYSGNYTSDDESTITITKENDKYTANISLFRLTTFDNCEVKDIKDDVLTIYCADGDVNPVTFTFNNKTKKLIVKESSWDILKKDDTFEFNA